LFQRVQGTQAISSAGNTASAARVIEADLFKKWKKY
jgi:hypothetical protein